jgi:glycerate 2-kinase
MDGIEGRVPETLKPGSPVFRRVHNVLIGSNRNARLAAWRYLSRKGITAKLFDEFYQGEATDVGASFAKELLQQRGLQKNSHPHALVAGGEATVTVRGSGSGGRDQELVLSAARVLRGRGAVTFAALATDGIDGPTRAAGAIVDDSTIERGLSQGLSANGALKRNDSNGYFRKLGGLILTGPDRDKCQRHHRRTVLAYSPCGWSDPKGADKRQEKDAVLARVRYRSDSPIASLCSLLYQVSRTIL